MPGAFSAYGEEAPALPKLRPLPPGTRRGRIGWRRHALDLWHGGRTASLQSRQYSTYGRAADLALSVTSRIYRRLMWRAKHAPDLARYHTKPLSCPTARGHTPIPAGTMAHTSRISGTHRPLDLPIRLPQRRGRTNPMHGESRSPVAALRLGSRFGILSGGHCRRSYNPS